MSFKPFDVLRKQPRWLLVVQAYLLVLLIGVVDYWTGYEVSVYVFYSIPILLVVWFAGRNAGLWISVVSALVWSAADIVGRSYEVDFERFWNMSVQLTFFIFIVLGGAALKAQRERSQARIEWLERFHTLAKISPVGIFRADLGGSLIYVNDRWRKISGFNDGAPLPMRWSGGLHADDRERVDAEWRRAVENQHPCEFEARFAHADGRTVWVLGQVAPERDAEGEVKSYVGAVTDMTELRRLEREVLEISEREQQRIGQDLHDDICQQLVAVQYAATTLRRGLQPVDAANSAMAAEIVNLLKAATTTARQMARRIFPVNLDQEGLMTALQELAENSSRYFGISCRFDCPHPILLEDNAVGAHLFRIAQEALSNAIRHGESKEVVISLTSEAHLLTLAIRDDGVGLTPVPVESTGMGLHIMRYRSRMIGASISIANHAEGGAIVRCTLPQRGGQLRALAESGKLNFFD